MYRIKHIILHVNEKLTYCSYIDYEYGFLCKTGNEKCLPENEVDKILICEEDTTKKDTIIEKDSTTNKYYYWKRYYH